MTTPTLLPEIEAAIADAGQALVDAWDSAQSGPPHRFAVYTDPEGDPEVAAGWMAMACMHASALAAAREAGRREVLDVAAGVEEAINDRYTQFYDERGNGPDVIRMDVEPMPTVIERNCHLVFARSEDDNFHATRFVPGGYRLDDRSSQWLMGRLMLWMSGQLVFTGYKDAARNLPGPIDVAGIVAGIPDALRVELRDALTAAIDAPRLAARATPTVAMAHGGVELIQTTANEWGVRYDPGAPVEWTDEPTARAEFVRESRIGKKNSK